jgi:GT2 family glycosyltransferase
MPAAEVDISLVVFRPRWEELEGTLRCIAESDREFRKVRILVSGSNSQLAQLETRVDNVGLRGRAEIMHRLDNLGFATGHNVLLQAAFDDGAGACLVLNPDVVIAKGAIAALSGAAKSVPGVALVGPVLRSAADPAIVDSMGIEWSRTGRHRDRRQGARAPHPAGEVTFQAGLTGACLLVSSDAFEVLRERTGNFFDDYFLAYREDAELGIRARAVGVSSALVDIDGFAHGRAVKGFERGDRLPDLLGVRNRFLLRWKLGDLRPGAWGVPTLRDLLVVVACLTVERRSMSGLREAFRVRRSVLNRGRRFRLAAGRGNAEAETQRYGGS